MHLQKKIHVTNTIGVCSAEEDTRLLAECALADGTTGRALDLGTGTGYVAIALALHGWEVDAVDISPKALELAQKNAALNGVQPKIFASNLFSSVSGPYDLIACNPPMRAEENETSRILTSTLRPFKSFTNLLLRLTQPFLERRRIHFIAGLARSACSFLAPGGRLVLVLSPFEEGELQQLVPRLRPIRSVPVPRIRGLKVVSFQVELEGHISTSSN